MASATSGVGKVGVMGGSRVLDEAYVEACRTIVPVRLLLFDLRVIDGL